MKILAIHTDKVGPIADGEISLVNRWTNHPEGKVLFTGSNGCGKSTILRAVAMLWLIAGHWLDKRKRLPEYQAPFSNQPKSAVALAQEWLNGWHGIAIVFDGIAPFTKQPVGLFYGDFSWFDQLRQSQPDICWIGETVTEAYKQNPITYQMELKFTGQVDVTGLVMPQDQPWIEKWAEQRKKMLISGDKVDGPNIIYFDAEERRWVNPIEHVSEPTPDVLSQRWLTQYLPTQQWQGQIESALINLKTTQLHRFHKVIKHLNEFLIDKIIDTDIKPGEERLRVKIKSQRGVFHTIDQLSAGERQVLILVFLISRWLQPGGVVLIDEPDMFLHPSLVSSLLSTIENIVKEHEGQLIITSHSPNIWQRYEFHGATVELDQHGEANE